MVGVAVAAALGAFISFVVIAVPFEYRIGAWRRLPALDHRLLPHLPAVFAAVFGAFFGSLSAFYLGWVQQSYHACVDALQIRYQELQKFYDNPRVSHQIRDFETGAGFAAASQKDLIFLRQATDALYVSVDRTLPRLASAVEKLEELIKTAFPGRQALRMTPDSPEMRANAR